MVQNINFSEQLCCKLYSIVSYKCHAYIQVDMRLFLHYIRFSGHSRLYICQRYAPVNLNSYVVYLLFFFIKL